MGEVDDIIAFYTSRPPDTVVDTAFSACKRAGFRVDETNERTQQVLDQEYKTVGITYDERSFSIAFNLAEDRPPGEPILSVRCGNLSDTASATNEREFRRRMDGFFELLCRLSVALDVDYAPIIHPDNRGVAPDDRPIAESLDELPRIGVYNRTVIDQFGGLEAPFDSPPWYTATLERDKIVVVETQRPWDDVDWRPPTDADFVTDASFADPAERGQQGPPDFEDPFAALETGAIGTDLCVPRERIGPEFRNEDLELVRVRVDGQRDLRRLETGAFVRNVVDEAPGDPAAFMMAMLEEIPPGATEDDLMVSALLHEAVPPAFIQLDDPDAQNVVTAVSDLELDVNKVELLVSLGSLARTEGFDDEDYAELIGFLETLDRLESVENIETAVRDRLC